MALYLKGIGDSLTRQNEIQPAFDASILSFLAQNTGGGGVCWFGSNLFNISIGTRSVSIGTGLCHAYGYFGMSDASETLNFIPPTGSNQFARVFAEINLSVRPHRFSIRATAQSTSSNIGLTQNNLSTTPNGIYQIPLYLLTIMSNGTISATDQRPRYTKIEHARLAEQSTNSTNAGHLTGSIASAVTATTQAQTNNSTQVATTAYCRTAIAAHERFTQTHGVNQARNTGNGDGEWGRLVLPNGMMILWYTSTTQDVTFPYGGFPNKCWFVGYAGHHGNGTADNVTSRNIGIVWSNITRTGFRWSFQSGVSSMNNRRYFAIGW